MSPSPPATSLASSDLWKPHLHCVFFKKKISFTFFSVSVAYGFCLWCYPTFCASINWKVLISFVSRRKQNKAKWSSKSLWIWAYSRLEGCWCYLKPVYLLGQFSFASQSSQHNFQHGTTCTSRFESEFNVFHNQISSNFIVFVDSPSRSFHGNPKISPSKKYRLGRYLPKKISKNRFSNYSRYIFKCQ